MYKGKEMKEIDLRVFSIIFKRRFSDFDILSEDFKELRDETEEQKLEECKKEIRNILTIGKF